MHISTVSYPPKEAIKEIDNLRHLISEKFNTKRALDWESHITIADRVSIPEDKINYIIDEIQQICNKTEPILTYTQELEFFKIENFPFENPYVIFIKVRVTEELQKIHQLIQEGVYKGFKRPGLKWDSYKPHITLAYRDLTEENFIKAKKFFQGNTIKTEYEFFLDNLQLIRFEKDELIKFKSFKLKG